MLARMNLNRSTLRLLGLFTLTATFAWAAEPLPRQNCWRLAKSGDAAPHNAFTDLVRFEDRWFCVFREGQAHVSPDGALRVITSQDGLEMALRRVHYFDQCRFARRQNHDHARSSTHAERRCDPPAPIKHQSLAWFSKDGQNWSEPVKIGDPNLWLWRTTWHKGVAYSIGYDTTAEKFIRLYTSKNGREFETLLPRLFDEGYPNETSLVFLPDDTCLCLLRRDGNPGSGKLGLAKPPYTKWEWKDLGLKIGGPHLLRLADGRIVLRRACMMAARGLRCWLDAEAGKLTEFLKLPSGGDSSYPGLVWHDGLLWVSYYSSHEGKTCIYLAKVRLPAL